MWSSQFNVHWTPFIWELSNLVTAQTGYLQQPVIWQKSTVKNELKVNPSHNIYHNHRDFDHSFGGNERFQYCGMAAVEWGGKRSWGMLGMSRLKAHVGCLALNSQLLFCFGSLVLLTHHTSHWVALQKVEFKRGQLGHMIYERQASLSLTSHISGTSASFTSVSSAHQICFLPHSEISMSECLKWLFHNPAEGTINIT